jgi:NlpC/P60 family putative phage cell wall peptidase
LGLVRGVWRELYGFEAEEAPAYSRDWAEASREEHMLDAADRHFRKIPLDAAGAGDLVIFRLRNGFVAKHAAILTSPRTMVHAMEGCSVSEVAVGPWWQRRLAGAFRFPGVQN